MTLAEQAFYTFEQGYPNKTALFFSEDGIYHMKDGKTMNHDEFYSWAKTEIENKRPFYIIRQVKDK